MKFIKADSGLMLFTSKVKQQMVWAVKKVKVTQHT